MSDKSINPPSTTDNSLARSLNHIGTKTRVKFDGSCLKQDQITFTHGKTVNICIVSEINLRDRGCDNYPVLEILVGTVKLVKNSDIHKCKYSGYGIGFDGRETFSLANNFLEYI